MMTKEYAEGLSEVLVILDNTEPEYVNRIPKKVMKFFEDNASKEYVPNINPDLEIKDMHLLPSTKDILSVIYMNYWTESKEQKQEFLQLLKDNQKEIDKETREKYNPNQIFESQSNTYSVPKSDGDSPESAIQDIAVTEYKENFFQKIITIIKSWIAKFR